MPYMSPQRPDTHWTHYRKAASRMKHWTIEALQGAAEKEANRIAVCKLRDIYGTMRILESQQTSVVEGKGYRAAMRQLHKEWTLLVNGGK